jgi:hypothetical protein
METREIYYWIAQLRLARKGSEEAIKTLESENMRRKEKNLPSVEKELKEILSLKR